VVTTPPPSPPLATPPPAAPFPTGPGDADAPVDRPLNGPGWWGRFVGTWEWGERPPGGAWFLTDCNFEGLISPVTNPFFFEDPRALTEVRPIFMYQKAPDDNPVFQGGHSEFFGLQARIAFTNRLSLVLNKFGWVALHPENPVPGVEDDTGFSEVYLGPKYTFLRRPESGFIGAAGLTFEIPLGSSRVSQDTGNLGLDPYVTLGKSFRVGGGFGSFNLLGEAGYNFSTDNKRSEFFHSSLHLDYNVANTNRFFPLVELNWFHYANPGKARVLGFEGADLVNFGSDIEGDRDYVTLAGGLRYKFSEHLQLGGAVEFPLTQQKLITDYRLTFDLILRY
jgi:hypothetical protein